MSALVLPFPRSPFTAKSNSPPRNKKQTGRKHLTEKEVEKLITAIGEGRHGHRNATAILIAYRHGLRCSELVNLQWSQVHFDDANIDIVRAKNGNASTHPLDGRELRALRKLKREYPGAYVFTNERGSPLSPRQFHHIVQSAGKLAELTKTHPHQLRHGCGYYLANEKTPTRTIQDYLGHRQISHTISPSRVKNGSIQRLMEKIINV